MVVTPEQAGTRLDVLLAGWLSLSRSGARELLSSGRAQLDERPLALKDKGLVAPADAQIRVEGFLPPAERRAPAPTGPPPPVLAEGPGWLAFDKPAGMPVHPLRDDQTETALGHALVRHPEMHGVGEGGLRSGIVHRLDVDTSGVLLMATTQETWQRLRQAFSEHRVRKVYRAIVRGELLAQPSGPAAGAGPSNEGAAPQPIPGVCPGEGPGELQIDLRVRVAQHKPARVRVLAPGEEHRDARPISMIVRPLEVLVGATLVEVVPTTGFLHQIRVAMAHLGHPLLGDRVYGHDTDDAGTDDADGGPVAKRHMLHATAVEFEEVEAECAFAADFAELLGQLQSRTSA
jgi:23S rRNA pseudouridine1911/1915/1917 synthase